MKFYTTLQQYYCGIDLHARILYVCILNQQGDKLVHQKIGADPLALLQLLEPYIGNVVVGVECMHCWYWVSDFCQTHEINFVLGHALYMKAIHGGKAKNYLNKLQRRMSKGKALSALAHKIGRCIYFMLKDKTVFDETKFLKG